MLPTADPIASNAALLGAKTVKSLAPSMVSTRLAVVRAPATALRPAATAVVEIFWGIVSTLSMTWITPPVKLIF